MVPESVARLLRWRVQNRPTANALHPGKQQASMRTSAVDTLLLTMLPSVPKPRPLATPEPFYGADILSRHDRLARLSVF